MYLVLGIYEPRRLIKKTTKVANSNLSQVALKTDCGQRRGTPGNFLNQVDILNWTAIIDTYSDGQPLANCHKEPNLLGRRKPILFGFLFQNWKNIIQNRKDSRWVDKFQFRKE